MWRILHISDFHIAGAEHEADLLRSHNYKPYVRSLVTLMSDDAPAELADFPPDLIVMTGDFVDKAGSLSQQDAESAFAHSCKVLSFLAESLSVPADRVVAIPGNHDDRGVSTGIRADLKLARGVVSSFGQACLVESVCEGFLSLYSFRSVHLEEERSGALWLLTVDTIKRELIGPDANRPTEANAEWRSLDGLGELLANHIRPKDSLVVASHYPIWPPDPKIFYRSRKPEPQFSKNWPAAPMLRQRVSDAMGSRPTLWLSGDLHADDVIVDGSATVLTCGRFAGPFVEEAPTRFERSALIIDVGESPHPNVWQLRTRSPSHELSSALLRFEEVKKLPIRNPYDGLPEQRRSIRESQMGQPAVALELTHPRRSRDSLVARSGVDGISRSWLALLDNHLNRDIYDIVSDERLFQLGRIPIHKGVALGWIDTQSLLNNRRTFGRLTTAASLWLKEFLTSSNPLCVGLGSWGAVLAQEIGLRLGASTAAIPAVDYRTDDLASRVDDSPYRDLICRSREIVLISDIEVDWYRLGHARQSLAAMQSSQDTKWHAFIAICDSRSVPSDFDWPYGRVAIGCWDIRLPVVSNEDVPNEEIFGIGTVPF